MILEFDKEYFCNELISIVTIVDFIDAESDSIIVQRSNGLEEIVNKDSLESLEDAEHFPNLSKQRLL